MYSKHVFSFFFLVAMLVLTACGQLSVGIVEPGAVNLPAEGEVVETAAPEISEPEVSPEPSLEPEIEPEAHAIPTLVFVGVDGNLWLLEGGSDAPLRLTVDANDFGGDGAAVRYEMPRLSSDGTLLAYRRDVGVPSGNDGYDASSGLYVLSLQSAEQTQVIEGYPGGWAWKPDSHVLAFSVAPGMDYFMTRGEPDPQFANGIFAIDLDSGTSGELVAPERGFTLASPQWSPDGRFLAFSEVKHMEGSGDFAYYDQVVGAYYSLEKPIGAFSWSQNGGLLTYSLLTYTPTGEERIYLREREGQEQPIGPDYEGPAYATAPVFSPDGSKIAYLAFLEGPEVHIAEVTVLDLVTGETRAYGTYQETWELNWTPDGSHLVFYSGPWGTPQINAVSLADGSQQVLAEGSQPALAGR